MPLPSRIEAQLAEAKQEGIKLGLRAAATILECNADDLDLAAAHLEKNELRGQAELARVQASLLRLQAVEVRELKVTEGRRG